MPAADWIISLPESVAGTPLHIPSSCEYSPKWMNKEYLSPSHFLNASVIRNTSLSIAEAFRTESIIVARMMYILFLIALFFKLTKIVILYEKRGC